MVFALSESDVILCGAPSRSEALCPLLSDRAKRGKANEVCRRVLPPRLKLFFLSSFSFSPSAH
jgi:hypothetical protein